MNIEYEFYREQANKIWDDFSNNIKYINRYFVGNEILKTLENITKYSGISILNNVVYRARIGNFIDKDEKEIKAPPIGKSSDGRGNPRGISYFYTSTNIHTAIAEVRPDKGAMITVGTFENKENLHLIDFRSILIYKNNRAIPLPISSLERCFTEVLLDKLTQPISAEESLDYIPLQYITEYIKLSGYDGLLYKSTVYDGANMLFFSDESFNLIDKKLYEISETNMVIQK